MKYIDIHGHLNFAAYDTDREEVIKRAQEAGVIMNTVGTNIATSKAALEIARAHDSMYAIVGLHPIHTFESHHDEQELGVGNKEFTSKEEVADLDLYRPLAEDPKTVAIGECGLDYYHLEESVRFKQVQAFESMIELANEVKKPLMLHIRNGSNASAYTDAVEILRSRAKVLGDVHFFAGSIEEAKLFLDLGFSFSFTGVVTFTRDYDEVIKYIPSDRIMSETDCPYISPVPFRGKRNEPRNVIETVKVLASIRGEDEEIMAKQIMNNAVKFFGITV